MLYQDGKLCPEFPKKPKEEKPLRSGKTPVGKERRKCIMQLRKEGRTLEEIADILECDVTTVKRNLRKLEEDKNGKL